MRVSQSKAGHDAGKPDCRLQQDPAPERHAARAAQEPAAERVGSVVIDQGIDKPDDIGGTVLSVGIERHNVTGALL
jgi:hypothetical protein